MFKQTAARNFPVGIPDAPKAKKFGEEPEEMPEPDFKNEEEGEEGHDKIANVVEEHGPAKETKIVHHGGGKHSVHSTHEDGHKHSSHDHDLDSAHEHSKAAFGHGAEPKEVEPKEPGAEDMQHSSLLPEMEGAR